MPNRQSTKNPITLHVIDETWTNANRIARSGVLTCLYRGEFTDEMVNESMDELVESWGRAKATVAGDGNQKALIIELMM